MTKLEWAFGIATIIGTLLAVWQTIKARNQNKELDRYKYLFEIADKSIDKEKTEEELEALKSQKEKMDDAINIDLPKKAHLTVLADRYREEERSVVENYKRFMDTKREYEQLEKSISTEIPESILKEIENHIMPQYMVKERSDNDMKILAILAYLSSFCAVLPIPRIVSRVLIGASIVPLVDLFRLRLPRDSQKRKDYLLKIGIITLAVIGGALLSLSFIIIESNAYYDDILILCMIGIGLLCVLSLLVLFSIKGVRIIKKRKVRAENDSDIHTGQDDHKK